LSVSKKINSHVPASTACNIPADMMKRMMMIIVKSAIYLKRQKRYVGMKFAKNYGPVASRFCLAKQRPFHISAFFIPNYKLRFLPFTFNVFS
jgi:hypothetical protein